MAATSATDYTLRVTTPGEAEPWIQRAERTVRPEAEPAAALLVYYVRGLVEQGRGHDREALAALQAAERPGGACDLNAAANVPR